MSARSSARARTMVSGHLSSMNLAVVSRSSCWSLVRSGSTQPGLTRAVSVVKAPQRHRDVGAYVVEDHFDRHVATEGHLVGFDYMTQHAHWLADCAVELDHDHVVNALARDGRIISPHIGVHAPRTGYDVPHPRHRVARIADVGGRPSVGAAIRAALDRQFAPAGRSPELLRLGRPA